MTTAFSCRADVFDTWCLWDTGVQSSMLLSRMLSKEVKGAEEEGYASLVIRYASRRHFKDLLAERFPLDLLEHQTASRLRLASRRVYRTVSISLY